MKRASSGHIRAGKSHQALDGPQLEAVAELFAVLSEPSRLRILQALQAGPLSAGELVERTGLKQANASKQLGILLSADVIDRLQDGNRAIFSISLPLVFELCSLVCNGIADQAVARAVALRSQRVARTSR